MAEWKRLFETFGIKHLRSPMFFHGDPADRDGLLAFTYDQRRQDELVQIRNCVGKELSKHRRKATVERKGVLLDELPFVEVLLLHETSKLMFV